MKNKKEKTVKEIFEMVKNDGHEFIVSGEFEKIALAKPVGITKSPEKIDLSKYIKQHENTIKVLLKPENINLFLELNITKQYGVYGCKKKLRKDIKNLAFLHTLQDNLFIEF